MSAALTDGDSAVTLRPDVQPINLNYKVVDDNRETIETVARLILKRLEDKLPKVRLADAFSFKLLSGCLFCGYVINDEIDASDRCAHCQAGVKSDLYITTRLAYVLVLFGMHLKLWNVWPPLDEPDRWVADKDRGRHAAFPLLVQYQEEAQHAGG